MDLVCDLSTEAFLATLRRFSSIYGTPSCILSDNSSKFVEADRELKQLYDLLETKATREWIEAWALSVDFLSKQGSAFYGLLGGCSQCYEAPTQKDHKESDTTDRRTTNPFPGSCSSHELKTTHSY